MDMKDFEFYSGTDLSKYSGKWVVIVNEEVVASGKDSKKLLQEVKEKYPGETPLLAKVPKRILQVLSV